MENFKDMLFRVTEEFIKNTPLCACGCGRHVGIKKNDKVRYWGGPACHQRAYRAKKRRNKVKTKKTCSWCKATWYPKTMRAKFCSNACRQANYRNKSKKQTNPQKMGTP